MKKKIIVFILTIIIASIFFSFYLLLKQENIKLVVKTNNLIALQRLTDVTDIIQKEFSEIINFKKNSDIIELKKKNIEVIKNYFTEKNFID